MRLPAAVALAVALIVLAVTAIPAAAPPFGPHPKSSLFDRYRQVVRHGHPVVILRRPVMLRRAPRGAAIARVADRTEWGSPRVLAIVGRRGSWLKVIATELRNGHRGWIPISSGQVISNPWSMRVDLSARRVSVMRNARVVRRFTVGIGSPVTPTPVGRFAVTDKLKMSGIVYGCCALALSGHQSHISQGWKGGDRIAIHGTLEKGSIGKAQSLGCLRANERDTRWIVNHVWLGTVVDIRR
jgi:hypothetical protein